MSLDSIREKNGSIKDLKACEEELINKKYNLSGEEIEKLKIETGFYELNEAGLKVLKSNIGNSKVLDKSLKVKVDVSELIEFIQDTIKEDNIMEIEIPNANSIEAYTERSYGVIKDFLADKIKIIEERIK